VTVAIVIGVGIKKKKKKRKKTTIRCRKVGEGPKNASATEGLSRSRIESNGAVDRPTVYDHVLKVTSAEEGEKVKKKCTRHQNQRGIAYNRDIPPEKKSGLPNFDKMDQVVFQGWKQ